MSITHPNPNPNSTFHLSVLSPSRNKLIVVSCDTLGQVIGYDDAEKKNYTTGCVSRCNRIDDIVINGSCSGNGCCQTSIPQKLSSVGYASTSFDNHTNVIDFNRCGYAFLVEDGAYNFTSTDLVRFQKTEFPVVVDWAVGNQTCRQANACKADNSECHDSPERKGTGYLCKCSAGFQGNLYLLNGCQDVDECMESNKYCIRGAICSNFPGAYNCSCPQGYEGDDKRCIPISNTNSNREIILIIALSVSASIIAILVASFCVYRTMKKRKLIKLKQQFFQQNGGLLLQQQIARHRGSAEMAKVFTIEELKEATNNFDEGRVLGQGGQGTVYKGLLVDNRIVAIKKSRIGDPKQIEQFITEVILLSQINHRNVVKLLGCCLETEFPLLVYEFIPNGTIYEHLHDHQSHSLRLTWKTRLRIATETAGALAYLHSATSTPIIHRDVKTTNILLDSSLTAKVSDFGASRIIPLDQSQLTTLVQGTLGYLDPEYFHTSQLTEKSDVYSFGVVLAELLTGKKALSFDRPEGSRNLALHFVSSMKEGRLLDIVDKDIIDEANVEQLMVVANIAKMCLRVNGEERPTMKEVAMELDGMISKEKHRCGSVNLSSGEAENLLKATLIPTVFNVEDGTVSGSGISSSGFDSLNQISMSFGWWKVFS